MLLKRLFIFCSCSRIRYFKASPRITEDNYCKERNIGCGSSWHVICYLSDHDRLDVAWASLVSDCKREPVWTRAGINRERNVLSSIVAWHPSAVHTHPHTQIVSGKTMQQRAPTPTLSLQNPNLFLFFRFKLEDSMQDLGKEIEITICTSCTECRIGRSCVESIPGREQPSYPWQCH